MALNIPNDIANDTPADATKVQENYDVIETYINTYVLHRDGSVALTSPLVLPGDPTQPNHAANMAYVDTQDELKLDKAGGAITGALAVNGAATIEGTLTARNQIVIEDTPPTAVNHAARRDYVDSKAAAAQAAAITAAATNTTTQLGSYLPKAGGQLTGTLLLDTPQSGADDAAVSHEWTLGKFISRDVSASGSATMVSQFNVNQDADVGNGISLEPSGRIYGRVTAEGTANLALTRSAQSPTADHAMDVGQRFALFTRGATAAGQIIIAGASSVTFDSTSDPRLKERTGDVVDAADLVRGLGAKAYRGRWKSDEGQGDEWVFLNSTDIEAVAPFAVHGEADAVDEEGQVVPQMVDHSMLVPLLCAALAQAIERIEVLEDR